MYREVKVVIRMCGQILGKYIRMYLHNRCIYSKAIYTQADLLRGITKPMQPHTATNKTTTNKSMLSKTTSYHQIVQQHETIRSNNQTIYNNPPPPRKTSQRPTTTYYHHYTTHYHPEKNLTTIHNKSLPSSNYP